MDTEEIYAALSAAFQQRTGLTGDCSTELSVRFYAVATQMEALYQQCVWVRNQCFPQTAAGEFLDYHAQLRGLSRREAVAATGTLRFLVDRAATTDLTIPAGTVCMTATLIQFETLSAAVLPGGSTYVDVPAQAVTAGSAGNVGAATVLSLSVPPVGISACTNPAPFSGGLDPEDDLTLRSRVLASYARMSNGANTAYYQQAALDHEGVAAVSVIGRSRGLGTVDVYIAGADGVPDQALLDSLQRYFDQQREIAVDVQVLAPVTQTMDVSLQLQVSDTADYASVASAVQEAVRSFFSGTLLGKGVSLGRLYALVFGVDGVEGCRLLSPTEDFSAQQQVLPVLGTLTIAQWEDDP